MRENEKTTAGKKKNVSARRRRGGDAGYRNLDAAQEVAVYYGFTLIDPPAVTKEDERKAKSLLETETRGREGGAPLHFSLEEKIALLRERALERADALSQPILTYSACPPKTAARGKEKKRAGSEREIALDVIGTGKSVAEAILVKTCIDILKEEGYKNLALTVNSIGDRESAGRFLRELTAYYRKNINELPPHCREKFKKDALAALSCKEEKCRAIRENAPKPISFLSEPSREHFKEVLEFLETLGVNYEIDNGLVDNRPFAVQTIFAIRDISNGADGPLLAVGARYGNLGKKLGFGRDIPGIGAKLFFKEKAREAPRAVRRPKMFFIQLGFEAKLKSLRIIELLRSEKIPIEQCLSRDKLISQLSLAENMKVPYTIIMGQKEALENTVIVRDMTSRSQDTVAVEELPRYLKKLR